MHIHPYTVRLVWESFGCFVCDVQTIDMLHTSTPLHISIMVMDTHVFDVYTNIAHKLERSPETPTRRRCG